MPTPDPIPEHVTKEEAFEEGFRLGRRSANRYYPHSPAQIRGWTRCRKCDVNLEDPHTTVCIGRPRMSPNMGGHETRAI